MMIDSKIWQTCICLCFN